MNDTLLLIDGIKSIINRLIPCASTDIAGNGRIDAVEAIDRIKVDVEYILNSACELCDYKDDIIISLEGDISDATQEVFDKNEKISELKTDIKDLEKAKDEGGNKAL